MHEQVHCSAMHFQLKSSKYKTQSIRDIQCINFAVRWEEKYYIFSLEKTENLHIGTR